MPTFWAIVLPLSLAVLLALWSAILTQRLREASGTLPSSTSIPPSAVGEWVRDGDETRLEIRGTPGATVVLLSDGVPLRAITLDRNGAAAMTGIRSSDDASLQIAVLAEPPAPLPPAPAVTPTSGATRTETQALAPSRTATAAANATSATTATASSGRPFAPNPSPTPRPAAGRRGTASAPPRRTHRPVGPTPGVSPPVLHLVTDAGPRLSVTFDGNASSNGTAELLDILQKIDLKITLFVTGGFVERYPTLVRRAVLAGHEVGNHTFSHPHLTSYAEDKRHRLLPEVNREWFHDQLRRTELAFREATGRSMAPLWRAPFGEENSTLRGWALELGYLHVRWSSLEGASLDARDWIADEHSSLYQDSRRMMDRLLGFPRLEGGIVLMHLATERSEPPWSELPRFLAELKRRKVQPIQVTELLERSATWRPWLERASRRHAEVFGQD